MKVRRAAAAGAAGLMMMFSACSENSGSTPEPERDPPTRILRDQTPTERGPQVEKSGPLTKNEFGCLSIEGLPLLAQDYIRVVGDNNMTVRGGGGVQVGDVVTGTGEVVDLRVSKRGAECFEIDQDQWLAFKVDFVVAG